MLRNSTVKLVAHAQLEDSLYEVLARVAPFHRFENALCFPILQPSIKVLHHIICHIPLGYLKHRAEIIPCSMIASDQ